MRRQCLGPSRPRDRGRSVRVAGVARSAATWTLEIRSSTDGSRQATRRFDQVRTRESSPNAADNVASGSAQAYLVGSRCPASNQTLDSRARIAHVVTVRITGSVIDPKQNGPSL